MRRRSLLAGAEELPDYLCFTARQANSSVTLNVVGTLTEGQALEISTDKVHFSDYTFGTEISLPNIGNKVYFRGNNTRISQSSSNYARFSMTGRISASGNIMSIVDKTCQSLTIPGNYCFYKLFQGCGALLTAPLLPATTLRGYCYGSMFNGCNRLQVAPSLPATVIVTNCYNIMFRYCNNLVTVPQLPATTLANNCYYRMFQGCSSLKVYSTGGEGHMQAWRIPTSGSAASYASQTQMFDGTIGDYAEASTVDLNQTFYTQNEPV